MLDLLILGAGQAGKPLALDAARAGWKTAVVERAQVGGSCINYGCTPTKTLVASGRVAYLARRAADYGIGVERVTVDAARVRARKRAIVDSFRSGVEKKLARADNLSLVYGEARFVGPREVEVALRDGGTERLVAERVVINTGGRPGRPRLPGLDDVAALDSTSVMELDVVPEHLVVLGGGYIGLELSQLFHRFGARVTVVQRGGQLLGREDDDVAGAIADVLREDGLEILLETEAVGVARDGAGVALTVRGPAGESVARGSHLLVATGRVPNTDRLGVEAAGVALDERGFVKVNERLETSAPGVWAAGDVNGGPAFTHISYDDYRVLRDRLLHGKDASTRGRLVPYTVFTDPELAHVGLTEREARAAGRPIQVAKMPMAHVARALEMDESRGFMKVVVDRESRRILGFTVLGVGGGELLAVVEMAMLAGLSWEVVRDAIYVHPTMAESLNNLFALL
jgi:pyruvate/2-oxoglutarate dehydrogenase complex dihydrolipoamide dehydrogenase (E3) component